MNRPKPSRRKSNPPPPKRRSGAGKSTPRADPARVEALRAYLDFQAGAPLPSGPPATLKDEYGRRLFNRLLRGMVRHRRFLEHEVRRLGRGNPSRVDRPVAAAAMMGILQLRLLPNIPPHAALFESVEAAARIGFGRAKGWINGVLRTALREIEAGAATGDGLSLELRTSHPDWMVARWRARYGDSACEAICEANNAYDGLTVRVEPGPGETPQSAGEAARSALAAEGISAESHPVVPGALRVERGGALLGSRVFREGRLYVQDGGSQLLTAWCAPLWRGWVADACAAPGGKLSHLRRLASGGTRLIGVDNDAARLNLIGENLRRLGLPRTPLIRADGRRLPLRRGSMAGVLLDVPCMATGMIRKYPEIKWRKRAGDIPVYAARQSAMLDEAARAAAPGGHILYSTCSLEPEENEERIADFLDRHPDWRRASFADLAPPPGLKAPPPGAVTPAGDFQLLPSPLWMGLYAALLHRMGDGER